MLIRSTEMGTKIRLSLIIFLLLIVSLKLRLPKQTSVMEVVKEAIQPLGSMLLKWQKKKKIKSRTLAISSATLASRKAIMPTSFSKSQKTSGGLGDLYVDDWKENKRRIGIGTLYLILHHLQRLNWGSIRFKKQNQCNKSSFCFSARPQSTKNQY